jgi:Protein of unknown function (DUF1800)
MWKQHLTLRAHATGNFAELLKAVAKDPAMLLYLDGITNAATQRNENFGRECLELFTMGRDGGYTQDDVVAVSRAFTGWVVDLPGRVGDRLDAPWNAVFLPLRHDRAVKVLLGETGTFSMDDGLEVILDHPSTARFVSAKLYRELVGLEPTRHTVDRLAQDFRRDYRIMPLVEAIVRDDAFVSDDAVRVKYRTPVSPRPGNPLRARRHVPGVHARMTAFRDEAGLTRRRFVTGLGVAAGAAVAAGYGLSVWRDRDVATTAHVHRPAPPTLDGRDDRTLVVVELGGGNDGLSIVVPISDPAYLKLRPTLGVPNAIPLDDSVAPPEPREACGSLPDRPRRDRRGRPVSRPDLVALCVTRVLVVDAEAVIGKGFALLPLLA